LNPKVKVPSSYKKGGEMPYRERNHSNLLLMKRSYNSMEILSSTSKFIARLLQTKFKIIGFFFFFQLLFLFFKKKKKIKNSN